MALDYVPLTGNAYNITGSIPFGPGGNPIQGMVSGGLQGLANQYETGYNSALAQNQAMYNNIMAGYQGLTGSVLGNIGNIGQAQWNNIQDQYAQALGNTNQDLINRGLGNTTVANAMQRGIQADRSKAEVNLASQLAQLYAGYQSQLGLGQLGFMNSVTAKYPNQQDYYNLFAQHGAAQQANADRALMQQQGNKSFSGGGGGSVRGPASNPNPWASDQSLYGSMLARANMAQATTPTDYGGYGFYGNAATPTSYNSPYLPGQQYSWDLNNLDYGAGFDSGAFGSDWGSGSNSWYDMGSFGVPDSAISDWGNSGGYDTSGYLPSDVGYESGVDYGYDNSGYYPNFDTSYNEDEDYYGFFG